MEWIVEGVSLIFIGVLTILTTITSTDIRLSLRLYWAIVLMLVSLSIVSLFTGFRIKFLPYRLCPVIFILSAMMILFGLIW